MTTLLIILVVILLLGGGGFAGHRQGYWGSNWPTARTEPAPGGFNWLYLVGGIILVLILISLLSHHYSYP